jgi:hypothetical protein
MWNVGDIVVLTRHSSEYHKEGAIAIITVIKEFDPKFPHDSTVGWNVPNCPCRHDSTLSTCNAASYEGSIICLKLTLSSKPLSRFELLDLE